eukprot:m.27451 g.27451  ORF g.27451 m.27451 type:complete len:62 (-) comp39761_c0_seq2:335-520(-)
MKSQQYNSVLVYRAFASLCSLEISSATDSTFFPPFRAADGSKMVISEANQKQSNERAMKEN